MTLLSSHFPGIEKQANYAPLRSNNPVERVGINARGLREQYCALFRHILFKHYAIDTNSSAPAVEIACKPFANGRNVSLEITPPKDSAGNILDDERWALAAHAVKKFTKGLVNLCGDHLLVESYRVDFMGIRFHPTVMGPMIAERLRQMGDEGGISDRHLYIIEAINTRMHDQIELENAPQLNN